MESGNRPRLIRSLVFRPGGDPEATLAEAHNGMDALCIDLEESTPDPAMKHAARHEFRAVAKELHAMGVVVMARTNGFDGGDCERDLASIMCLELHCVNFPKTRAPEDIVRLDQMLGYAERAAGLPIGHTLIRPTLETALSIKNAYEIAVASPRVTYMGAAPGALYSDLGRSIGLDQTPDALETLYIRSKVIVDVRAANVPFPIGGGRTRVKTVEALRAFAVETKMLGYSGFYCPGVKYWSNSAEAIAAVNEVFTPTLAELEEWYAVDPQLTHPRVRERVAFVRERTDLLSDDELWPRAMS
jgi:citrate lyase subunit beta/citryl-CoA lyase